MSQHDETGQVAPMRPARSVLRMVGHAIVRAARAIRWYVRELLGANAYDHYLERFALDHADVPACDRHEPLTEREFWKYRIDNLPQDAHCC